MSHRSQAPAPPAPATGTEFLGEYAGSGFKQPPFLVRRADGQVVQLPRLLYLIAEQADGTRGYDEIAAAVGAGIRRGVTADNVRYLVEERLLPLGVLGELAAGRPTANPMLALKLKAAVMPPEVVRVLAAIFSPFFFPPVIIAALGTLVCLDFWLFGVHGIAQSVRGAFFEPGVILLVLALIVLSAAFHECGHAAATHYGGARPGAMGVGLYIVWPALYTDITDVYRLGRGGRLRADLGGVYFNVLFILGTAAAYFLTGFEPLLVLIPIQHAEIVHQFLPFLRLDGYYILSDLTGVPDMFSRIKPTLRSLVPGVEADRRVQELKTWARAVVTGYVLVLVPVLLFLFGTMALAAPRIFGTAWAAAHVQWHRAEHALDARLLAPTIVSALQLVVLVLPPAGLALTFWRTARRATAGVWRATDERPRARNLLVAVTTAVVTAVAVNWWTTGAYRPIRASERGTVRTAFAEAGDQLHVSRRDARPQRPAPQRPRPSRPAPARPVTTPRTTPRTTGAVPTTPRTTGAVPTTTTRAPASTHPTQTTQRKPPRAGTASITGGGSTTATTPTAPVTSPTPTPTTPATTPEPTPADTGTTPTTPTTPTSSTATETAPPPPDSTTTTTP